MNGLDYNISINTIYEQASQSKIWVCLHPTPEHRLTTHTRARARATSKAVVVMGDARYPLEIPAISRALSTRRATCSPPAYLLVRQCPALHMYILLYH